MTMFPAFLLFFPRTYGPVCNTPGKNVRWSGDRYQKITKHSILFHNALPDLLAHVISGSGTDILKNVPVIYRTYTAIVTVFTVTVTGYNRFEFTIRVRVWSSTGKGWDRCTEYREARTFIW